VGLSTDDGVDDVSAEAADEDGSASVDVDFAAGVADKSVGTCDDDDEDVMVAGVVGGGEDDDVRGGAALMDVLVALALLARCCCSSNTSTRAAMASRPRDCNESSCGGGAKDECEGATAVAAVSVTAGRCGAFFGAEGTAGVESAARGVD
jgi:hypothetical protein